MASPPPNPDTRELPYGWIQQYNWEYRQWFYVNARENPPRSSWEHPLGPMAPSYAPPLGPPPSDRSYGRPSYGGPPPAPPPDRGWNRSPYGGPQPPPSQGYGGYPGYQQPPQGYYSNAPQGGYASGTPYGAERGYPPQSQVVYVEEEQRKQRKGPGMGTALLAGGAGLVGGALLTEAFESHNEREREEGYQQGYDAGLDDGQPDSFDF